MQSVDFYIIEIGKEKRINSNYSKQKAIYKLFHSIRLEFIYFFAYNIYENNNFDSIEEIELTDKGYYNHFRINNMEYEYSLNEGKQFDYLKTALKNL